ncbi:hypothetical protein [Sinorhizobium meliloti]|uniref:hypothetical protein n=1 Tax=Rhizobium meliloti TaxID=382 RepID=UPI003D64E7AA
MTTVIIVENPSPSFVSLSVDNSSVIEIERSDTASNSLSLITATEQGPAGPVGPTGPTGPGFYDDLPDMYLIFEGALI